MFPGVCGMRTPGNWSAGQQTSAAKSEEHGANAPEHKEAAACAKREQQIDAKQSVATGTNSRPAHSAKAARENKGTFTIPRGAEPAMPYGGKSG
jgi:hypothetical protein